MPSLKLGRRKKNGADAESMPGPEAAPEAAPAEMATTRMEPVQAPVQGNTAADYTPPEGAEDFQLPERHYPAEPPPSPEPTRAGSLLSRALLDPGEQTAAERDRIAALEFEQAIAPVMEYMRAAVPEASTPEEAARILAANQGEITPDPEGGAYVHGDAYDKDARVYYRLLRRDYEKDPRPSQKRPKSHHLHEAYGKLTGNKGW